MGCSPSPAPRERVPSAARRVRAAPPPLCRRQCRGMLANGCPRPHIFPMFAEAQQARDDAGAAADRVGVTRLVLTDFRNYRESRLTVGTAPVVLTGPNGAGKTNLLEAVSFLAPGRGLRGAKLTEIDRRARPGQKDAIGGWAVAAVVATRRGSLRIGTGRDATAGE